MTPQLHTLVGHAAQETHPATNARAVPIHQTIPRVFDRALATLLTRAR